MKARSNKFYKKVIDKTEAGFVADLTTDEIVKYLSEVCVGINVLRALETELRKRQGQPEFDYSKEVFTITNK